jgi:hypothetical protein
VRLGGMRRQGPIERLHRLSSCGAPLVSKPPIRVFDFSHRLRAALLHVHTRVTLTQAYTCVAANDERVLVVELVNLIHLVM